MANQKLTQLGEVTTLSATDLLYVVTNTDTTPVSKGITKENLAAAVATSAIGSNPVENNYADTAAMIADQSNQTANFFQVVNNTDYYEYLGTTAGTIADYRLLSDTETTVIIGSNSFKTFNISVIQVDSTALTTISGGDIGFEYASGTDLVTGIFFNSAFSGIISRLVALDSSLDYYIKLYNGQKQKYDIAKITSFATVNTNFVLASIAGTIDRTDFDVTDRVGVEFDINVAGGGSGTVTSVAVSGSDGIEIDSGSPITASGTIALGLNKESTLSFLGLSATFPLGLAFGDETTDIAVGTDKLTFQMPHFATTLTGVSVNVKTAPTGSEATFDLNEAGTSVLSTKITIDAGEKTSVTASTPPVISESAIPANAIMTVDIDGVGSTVAGVAPKLWIYYTVPKIAPNVPNMFPFKFTVNTALSGTSALNQFTIPVGAGTFLYDVTTDDGYSATGLTGNHTITFPTGTGTHTVEITGSFPAMRFDSTGDKLKFSTIENFGIYGINSLDQSKAFLGCSNLLVNATDIGHLENVTNFTQFFQSCTSITSIPIFNTSSATSLVLAFYRCSSLTEFPLIPTSNVNDLLAAFQFCSSLTGFPLIDTSSVNQFSQAWKNCNSMTSFPAINTIEATSLGATWGNCASLETFSGNVFDNSISTSNYSDAFLGTNLTEQSIDNILVSIDANGVSNGTFAQSGGTTPSATGLAAKDSLVAKGWTIVYTT